MQPTDGGPAFPRNTVGNEHVGTIDFGAEGMTLRDAMALATLAGIHASCTWNDWPEEKWCRDAATFAYQQADAMLAERAKSDSPGTSPVNAGTSPH